jgi:tetratricopeptide (TPR) repeat protein
MATNTALKYKEKGNIEFKKGNLPKAIEYYTYACEVDPKNCIFYTNRATCYMKMGRYDKVVRDASKAIKLNSKWEKGYYRLGTGLMELGRFDEAVKAYKQAVDLKPSNATFQSELIRAKRSMLKGKSEAEIIKIDANELFKAGKIDDAIKMYTRAIAKCNVKDEKEKIVGADIYANRAACQRQLYHPKKCIDDCTAAIELNPYHTKAYIRRAQSLESLEKWKDALADFEKALMYSPGVSVAVQGASRIRSSLRREAKMKGK